MKKIKCFISIIAIYLVIYSLCFEKKLDLIKRYNLYKTIKDVSNNNLNAEMHPNKGLYCKANNYIAAGSITSNIPIENSICPHYLFPFKFEIYSYLEAIPFLKQGIGKDQKLSVYVLVYYVLYYLYADKTYINNYIEKNKLEIYKNLDLIINKNIEDFFPKTILGKSSLNKHHYESMSNKSMVLQENTIELLHVYENVINSIIIGDYNDALYHWCSDFNKFQYAHGIVMSRGMTIRLPEYYTLTGIKNKKQNEADKINLKINQSMCQLVGCPCIILYIDLCNHYQPNFKDLRDKRSIILDTKKNYFVNISPRNYDIDEEFSYTYSNDPNSFNLFMNYGFVLPDNIFSTIKVSITDNIQFNSNKLKLCKELNCISSLVTDASHAFENKDYTFSIETYNEKFLNYNKVKSLTNKDINSLGINSIIKQLKTKSSNIIEYIGETKEYVPLYGLSFFHDITTWINYYKKIYEQSAIHIKEYTLSISENQHYRNLSKSIEKDLIKYNNKEATNHINNLNTKWIEYKNFELISEMDITYKRVFIIQTIESQKQIINILNNSINSYINNLEI